MYYIFSYDFAKFDVKNNAAIVIKLYTFVIFLVMTLPSLTMLLLL